MAPSIARNEPILIVGAGVFGLSTALHLAQRGYTNVTVIDKQDYDRTLYSYDLGADAASADVNKVFRMAYGSDIVYQNLALEALGVWKQWNKELGTSTDLPPGLSSDDVVYVNSGSLNCSPTVELPKFELDSKDHLTAAGMGSSLFVVNNAEDKRKATERGFGYALDPFNRESRGKPYSALLDASGGLCYADKGCLFALHKARSLGVKFIFGIQGTFEAFLYKSTDQEEAIGARTADGVDHTATLTIVAGGGWTPTVVPELDGLCETTAGSVCFYQIPPKSPLWDRFSSENFPTWSYAMRDGAKGGLYGFPRDEMGILKIGYRGTKYTNPVVQSDGRERSVPISRWSRPKITSIPSTALKVVKSFVAENLPEIVEHKIPLIKSRLCWYSDSFDNNLIIDRVPSKKGVMVATGGSGHSFKYLPVLGRWVVNIIEGKQMIGDDAEVVRRWRWRSLGEGVVPYNSLMEGSTGDRALTKQILIPDQELMGDFRAIKSSL